MRIPAEAGGSPVFVVVRGAINLREGACAGRPLSFLAADEKVTSACSFVAVEDAMLSKRRQMVFAPEINPHSFLFFFRKGEDSWSVRDYSSKDRKGALRYARDFGFSLDDFHTKVVQSIDAPAHPTQDIRFWHEYTVELNRTYLGTRQPQASDESTSPPNATRPSPKSVFPIIERRKFDLHPKSRKPMDRKRMEESPASEDWVTWTVFQLFERSASGAWWSDFVAHAEAENPSISLPPGWEAPPQVRLWETVPAPAAYERASRLRMAGSANSEWVSRSQQAKPVEGSSEIDIILENDAVLVFLEAKLGSDISTRTTYDPDRNQIVRNIDCLLDQAGGRTPIFWMLVRDAGEHRSYTQVLRHYRANPEALMAELPHQPTGLVADVAQNLSLLRWHDVAKNVSQTQPDDNAEIELIKAELGRRL